MWALIVASALVLQCQYASSQSMEINKTIREELLPGFVIADLAAEADFITAASKDRSEISDLLYSILTSGNPKSHFFAVDAKSGVVTIQNRIDREQVCSFRDECHLRFEVAARSAYGVFFLLVNFNIVVTDINDNPPEFTQLQFDLYVPENSDIGRTFQLPTAFDRDTGVGNGVSEYRILEGPDLFGLKTVEMGSNSSDVFLTLEKTITREVTATYKVSIVNPPLLL